MGLSDFFIRVLCIGSVLLYAASAALITNPQTQPSSSIVAKLLQTSDSKTSSFEATTVEDQFLLTSLNARINSLQSLFNIIGPLQQPLTIVIDRDHLTRVSIGSTDLILGANAVKAKGQLEHAALKAWIRQVGSSEVLSHPLRAEVYADLIMATYAGELNLQDPQHLKVAEFIELDKWSDQLLGTAELCESAWRPAELISYCQGVKHAAANTQTSYSLRNVVGSLIWQEISSLSLLERRSVLKKLSRNIKSQAISIATLKQLETKSLNEFDSSLTSLQESIETEALEIYPELSGVLPTVRPAIGVYKKGKLSLIGGFEINSIESEFKKIVVESCSAPKLDELLSRSSDSTEHILLVQNCENKRVNYSGFAKFGIARFAHDNRTVKFAYLHRESLKLANKMINNFDIHAALAFDPQSKDGKFLGLDQKIFRDDVGAYKVNGPIGAIEWYRPESVSEKSNESESRS